MVADEELQLDSTWYPYHNSDTTYLTTAVPEHLLWSHPGDNYNHYHNKLREVVLWRSDRVVISPLPFHCLAYNHGNYYNYPTNIPLQTTE